jgi:hypothetical protein
MQEQPRSRGRLVPHLEAGPSEPGRIKGVKEKDDGAPLPRQQHPGPSAVDLGPAEAATAPETRVNCSPRDLVIPHLLVHDALGPFE